MTANGQGKKGAVPIDMARDQQVIVVRLGTGLPRLVGVANEKRVGDRPVIAEAKGVERRGVVYEAGV